MKKRLYHYVMSQDDFLMMCRSDKKVIKEFLDYEFENKMIKYLDKKYLDIAWVIIDSKIIDVDSLWNDFKSYLGD